MHKFKCLLASVLISSGVQAQTISYESFTISELTVAKSWENFRPMLDAMFLKLESDFKSGGATDRAAKVLTDQFSRGLTKESFSRLFAEVISEKMSPEEQREVLKFIQSEAGTKYFQVVSSQSDSLVKYFLPLFKQACATAEKDLGFFDRGSIKNICTPPK